MSRMFPGRLRHGLTPYAVLGISLGVSAAATFSFYRFFDSKDQLRFEHRAWAVRKLVESRVEVYIALLRSLAGLLTGDEHPSPETYRRLVGRVRMSEFYPGIQGLGFTRRVPASEKDAFVALTRRKLGMPDFRVWPETSDPDQHAIVFLEPLDRRNLAAIGYNMYSEDVRRAAMERARDGALPAASGKVTLVQEIDERKQAGFLIYVPVYRGSTIPASVEARRRDLLGFAYSPFRASDFMDGIFGGEYPPDIGFRVYSGSEETDAALLHATPSSEAKNPLRASLRLDVAGQPWTMSFYSLPGFDAGFGRGFAPVLAIGGLLLSGILFAMTSAESRARAAAERLAVELKVHSMALDNMAEGVSLSDEAGILRYTNPAHDAMFGYSRGELLGRHVTALNSYPSEENERIVRAVIEQLKARGRWAGEFENRRKDGSPFITRALITALDIGGRKYWICVQEDVSERKRMEASVLELTRGLERRVEERTAQLESALAQMEAFSYSIAHDLRAPLRGIHSFCDALLEDFGESFPPGAKTYFGRVTAAASRMDRLIDDLLSYARLGREQVERRVLRTEALVDDLLREMAEERVGAPADLTVERPLPDVLGDPVMLKQALRNLLSNALKFTRPGEPPRVRVGGRRDGSRVRLWVEDRGIGVPEDQRDKLFRVFERLGGEAYPGTGIGLAIVKRSAERMGGTTGMDAAPGGGSRFWIDLPAAEGDGP